MYTPRGVIDGAQDFHNSLRESGVPYVFASNTGAKGYPGVQSKLAESGITYPGGELVPKEHIYTASQALGRYMVENIPSGSRVFVFAGGTDEGVEGSFWMQALRRYDPALVDSWDVRTFLTEQEAKEWGEEAAASASAVATGGSCITASSAPPGVYVVCFSDGQIHSMTDPKTGELGFADWSFDVIKKASYLISHGASFLITAEDSFNMRPDGWPLPGPGMIAAMFRTLMYPQGAHRIHCCGKGGNMGNHYMMDRAIDLLRSQGHSGRRDEIVMVGDRFDTDVRAGVGAGIKSCLVESGCHSLDLQRHYAQDQVDFVASSVAELVRC